MSRQAIHDLLKRVEQTLEHYEEMLGFLQRVERTRRLTVEAAKLLDTVAAASGGTETGRSDKAAISGNAAEMRQNIQVSRLREIVEELNDESR